MLDTSPLWSLLSLSVLDLLLAASSPRRCRFDQLVFWTWRAVERLSPVWVPFGAWSLFETVMRKFAAWRYAQALRLAVYYTSMRLASMTASDIRRYAEETAELYAKQPPGRWGDRGRLKQVGLLLHSTYPLRRILRELRAVLGRDVSRNFAAVFALRVAADVPVEYPQHVVALAKKAWEDAWRKSSTRAEFLTQLRRELELRRMLLRGRDRDLYSELVGKSPEELARILGVSWRVEREGLQDGRQSFALQVLRKTVKEADGDVNRFIQLLYERRQILEKDPEVRDLVKILLATPKEALKLAVEFLNAEK